jgi:hypothetical protein
MGWTCFLPADTNKGYIPYKREAVICGECRGEFGTPAEAREECEKINKTGAWYDAQKHKFA